MENRAAQFVSVICYIDPQGKDHYFRGECPGEVGFEEKGDGGFGYDPLFMVGGEVLRRDKRRRKGRRLPPRPGHPAAGGYLGR